MVAREHRATRAERLTLAQSVELKDAGAPKGIGAFALRDLTEGEFVGVLPGRVLREETHDFLVQSGAVSGDYAMETFDRGSETYVVEPEALHRGRPSRRFRSSIGHFMNEPAAGEQLNVAWAFNPAYDPERVDCYTIRPVEAGGELLVHYGLSYRRSYEGPSESPPPEYVPRVPSDPKLSPRKGWRKAYWT